MTASTPTPSMRQWVFQDWRVNAERRDSRIVLVLFRGAQWALRNWGRPGRWIASIYRLTTSLLLSIEIPPECEIGPRLRLFHPHAIVLNPAVRFGADCILRQGVTVGNTIRRDGTEKGVASLGDAVDLGAGCVVVGDLHVGDHARIGALAVVLEDVPAWGVVVGNPARLVRVDEPR
jgi:serine acetyltransferase